MSWASDRMGAFKDGLQEKRYVLGSLTAVVVGAADWILAWLRGHGMTGEAFGIPSWIVGVVFAVALVAWWLLEYCVRLRQIMAPKLSIEFGGVVTTPLKRTTVSMMQNGSKVVERGEFKGVVIRGVVRPHGQTVVANCAAYLTAVRYQDPGTKQFSNKPYTEDLQLPWSHMGAGFIAIPSGVRRSFDIADANEERVRLDPCGEWPLTLRGLFKETGAYQLDVLVTGAGASERATFEITWTGDIFDIKGLQLATNRNVT